MAFHLTEDHETTPPISSETGITRNEISPPSVSKGGKRTANNQDTNDPAAKRQRKSSGEDISASALSLSSIMAPSFRPGKLSQIEILKRLFPAQKSNVLGLVLQGCNGDVVKTIEHFLSANEPMATQDVTLKAPQPYSANMRFQFPSPWMDYSKPLASNDFQRLNSTRLFPKTVDQDSFSNRTLRNPSLPCNSYVRPWDVTMKSLDIAANRLQCPTTFGCETRPTLPSHLGTAFPTMQTTLTPQVLFPNASEHFANSSHGSILPSSGIPNPFMFPFGLYNSYPLVSGPRKTTNQ